MAEPLTIPGFVNVHCHAFQRALRGRTEGGDFWAWRESMLDLAARLAPGQVHAAYADVYTMRSNGSKVRPLIRGVGSAYVEDVSPNGHTLLFRRDQGLWSKRIGPGGAHKLAQLPDGSETNGVFSSDGRQVAAFVAVEDQQSLVAIDVAGHRQTQLAEGFEASEKDGTVIGPVIAWQPVPPKG